MKKLLSICLSIAMIFALMPANVFAEDPHAVPNSIEDIPNEVIEATLPQCLRDALNSDVATCGTSKPTDTYNLTTQKDYNFTVTSVLNTTIYSKYIFVGHNGTLNFEFYDSSNDGKGYTVKVYQKGFFTTTVATYEGTDGTSLTFPVNVASDAKIYFAVIPNGTTYITGTLSCNANS